MTFDADFTEPPPCPPQVGSASPDARSPLGSGPGEGGPGSADGESGPPEGDPLSDDAAARGGPSDEPRAGDSRFDDLFLAIELELRGIAHRLIESNRRVDDVETTVLVHSMYLKLRATKQHVWKSADQLLAVSSTILRNLMTDAARHRRSRKRGGGAKPHELDALVEHFEGRRADGTPKTDLLDLDAALEALGRQDPTSAKMVELHYYTGVSDAEIARVFRVSARSLQRKLENARSYLKSYMSGHGRPDTDGPSTADRG